MTDNVEIWSGKDRADENFPVGSGLIRADLRGHIHAYYKFARTADDIGDSAELSADEKIRRLNVMDDVLAGRGDEGSPSALVLRATCAATGLDPNVGSDLLVAFRQDATKLRYNNWEELYNYCVYSAMPVGRLLLGLHGEAQDTLPPSNALCASLQVLNHLQDCQGDLATLDRCYLPLDLMALHGATIDDVRAAKTSSALRGVFDDLLDACDKLNAIARTLPALVRDRRMRVEAAMVVNLCLRLTQLLRQGDPLASRVKLRKPDFAFALIKALRYLP